jgi:predicted NUDIX family NTP pyrophosphohydrolase
MNKKSAGILAFRKNAKGTEIFLMHPGGPFWKNKDAGAWSIPKGEIDETESEIDAAKREFEEETGIKVKGEMFALQPIRQKNGKLVTAWALDQDIDAAGITCNLFEMEWPPKSGKYQQFPEMDRAEWFSVTTAKEKIIPAQAALIDQLEEILNQSH